MSEPTVERARSAYQVLEDQLYGYLQGIADWKPTNAEAPNLMATRKEVQNFALKLLRELREVVQGHVNEIDDSTLTYTSDDVRKREKEIRLFAESSFDMWRQVSQSLLVFVGDSVGMGLIRAIQYDPAVASFLHSWTDGARQIGDSVVRNEQLDKWDSLQNDFLRTQHEFNEIRVQLKNADATMGRLNEIEGTTQARLAAIEADSSEFRKSMVVALSRAEDLRDELDVSLANAQNLTEGKATNELTRSFATYRRDHAKSYKTFMKFAIAGFLGTATLAGVLSFPGLPMIDAELGSWPGTVWRIALVSGLLGISTFLAKQAVHHRGQAQWADSIQVQLKTFKAYTDLLPESAQRDLLRAEFARRVFGPEPSLGSKGPMAESGGDISVGKAQEVVDILKSLKAFGADEKRAGSVPSSGG